MKAILIRLLAAFFSIGWLYPLYLVFENQVEISGLTKAYVYGMADVPHGFVWDTPMSLLRLKISFIWLATVIVFWVLYAMPRSQSRA